MKNTKKQKGAIGLIDIAAMASILAVIGTLALKHVDHAQNAVKSNVLKSQLVKMADAQLIYFSLNQKYLKNEEQANLSLKNIHDRSRTEPSAYENTTYNGNPITYNGANVAQRVVTKGVASEFVDTNGAPKVVDMYTVCNPTNAEVQASFDTTPTPICTLGQVLAPVDKTKVIPGELFTDSLRDTNGFHEDMNFVVAGYDHKKNTIMYLNSLGASTF